MRLAASCREFAQTASVFTMLCLLMITSMASVIAQNQSRIELDPAPLTRLLQDVLLSIIDEEYDKALALCEIALNVSLPIDIRYTHVRLYKDLTEISSLLKTSKHVFSNASVQGVSLDIVYRMHIARDKLRESVDEYLNKLSKYFTDPSTRYLMTVSIRRSTESIVLKIDLEIDKLLQMYMRGVYGSSVTVYAKAPEKVYGGEKFYLSLYVDTDIKTSTNASIKITAMFGYAIVKKLELSVPLGVWVDVDIDVPGAEELEAMGISPLSITRAKIYITAVVDANKTVVYGYTLCNTSVVYERPSIKFSMPGNIYLGQPILVSIESSALTQINLSAYLDIVSNETLVLSTTISPGLTNITIVLPNISSGYHKLIFITQGVGRYATSAYTYVFAVSRPRPSIVVSISDLAVFPLSKIRVSLYVDTSVPYVVSIYINNRKVAERVYIDSSKVELEIEPPVTLLMWRYSVVTEVKPVDTAYDPSFREGYTYVLNLPALIAIPSILSIVLATPSTSKYVVFSLKFTKSRLERVVHRAEGLSSGVPQAIDSYSFRRPRLANLYRKFIHIVSKYVEPPRKSETLREFYNRFELTTIKSMVKHLVKMFLDIYEEDLYSVHSIDEDLARDAVKRLDSIGENA